MFTLCVKWRNASLRKNINLEHFATLTEETLYKCRALFLTTRCTQGFFLEVCPPISVSDVSFGGFLPLNPKPLRVNTLKDGPFKFFSPAPPDKTAVICEDYLFCLLSKISLIINPGLHYSLHKTNLNGLMQQIRIRLENHNGHRGPTQGPRATCGPGWL